MGRGRSAVPMPVPSISRKRRRRLRIRSTCGEGTVGNGESRPRWRYLKQFPAMVAISVFGTCSRTAKRQITVRRSLVWKVVIRKNPRAASHIPARSPGPSGSIPMPLEIRVPSLPKKSAIGAPDIQHAGTIWYQRKDLQDSPRLDETIKRFRPSFQPEDGEEEAAEEALGPQNHEERCRDHPPESDLRIQAAVSCCLPPPHARDRQSDPCQQCQAAHNQP